MEDNSSIPSSPRKKIKLSHDSAQPQTASTTAPTAAMSEHMSDQPAADAVVALKSQTDEDEQLRKELEVGIVEFVSPELPGFSGVLKKRYTDFLVNEILPSGQVVHLDSYAVPKPNKQQAEAAETKAKAVDESAVADVPETATEHETGAPIVAPKSEPASTVTKEPEFAPPKGAEPEPAPAQDVEPKPASESSEPKLDEQTSEENQGDPKPPADVTNVEANETQSEKPEAPNDSGEKPSSAADSNEKEVAAETNANDAASGWQSFADEQVGFKLADEDRTKLESFFDANVATELLDLFNRIVNSPHRRIQDYGSVKSGPITDRQLRTQVHQELRRIFSGRLESNTGDDGSMVVTAARGENARPPRGAGNERGRGRGGRDRGGRGGRGGRGDRGGRGGRGNDGSNRQNQKPLRERFAELGGDYLHFSVYKENKDTMEVVFFIARQLGAKVQSFNFAGTKDRRGITVQRVSVHRVFADRLLQAGKTLRNAKIGNFSYHPSGLQLGELTGNEFVITLRDCQFASIDPASDPSTQAASALRIVQSSMTHLATRGYLNYFGLQRFGSFSIRTDTIGTLLLRGDYKGAVNAILDFSPSHLAAPDPSSPRDKIASDDRARALALQGFRSTGDPEPALRQLPRKFSAESSLIRHLGGAGKSEEWLSALLGVPRNLRLMYVHAYQSLVWNLAASRRWREHGDAVLEGDLVLVSEHRGKMPAEAPREEVDEDGEVVVHAEGEDRAVSMEERFERARALTREEVEGGRYGIFDVVLPTPGYDVLYPGYLEGFYREVMAREELGGLDPRQMRRNVKDLSLSGSYRKLLARPGPEWSCRVESYGDEDGDRQFVETDLEKLEKRAGEKGAGKGKGAVGADKAGEEKGAGEDKAVGEGRAAGEDTAMGEDKAADEDKATDEAKATDEVKAASAVPADVPPASSSPNKLAVILKLQLGSSQYATMALRELMKAGGVKTYKPDYGGR